MSLLAETPLDALVHTALQRNPYFTRKKPAVEAADGRVVLRGTVQSYYHKQVAQEVLRRVDGVQHIENHLEVDWA